MKKIQITTKTSPEQYARVSDKDYSKLNKHRWVATKVGNKFYVRTKTASGYVNMGRMIHNLSSSDTVNVQYKNGNTFDNTRQNLLVKH